MIDQAQQGYQPQPVAELLMNLRFVRSRLVQPTPPLLPFPCKSSIALTPQKKTDTVKTGKKATAPVIKTASTSLTTSCFNS